MSQDPNAPEPEWSYVPSCPCDRCEDYRRDNGLTCMFGIGPRPEYDRRHITFNEAAGYVKPTPGLGPVNFMNRGG